MSNMAGLRLLIAALVIAGLAQAAQAGMVGSESTPKLISPLNGAATDLSFKSDKTRKYTKAKAKGD